MEEKKKKEYHQDIRNINKKGGDGDDKGKLLFEHGKNGNFSYDGC